MGKGNLGREWAARLGGGPARRLAVEMRVLGRKHRWRSEDAPKPPGRRPMRSEVTDACFEVLEACRTHGATDDVRMRWEAVWGQVGSGVSGLDLRVAGLVLHTGWTVATALGDHRRAASHMAAYLRHPLQASDDPVVAADNRCRLARSYLGLGEARRAAELLARVFADGSRATAKSRVLCVRDTLLVALDGLPGEAVCAPEIAAVASSVASRLRRRKAAAAMLLEGATNAVVADGLRLTVAG